MPADAIANPLRVRTVAGALAVLFAACGSPTPSTGGPVAGTDPGFDYTFNGDAVADGSAVDSSAVPDAATPVDISTTPVDGGMADSGAVDGGGLDTAAVDGGAAPDAGVDASVDSGASISCGDGTCTANVENCQNCPQDCNVCPVTCGDNKCEAPTETCLSCPQDCGACDANCGDGTCTKDKEDCKTCPQDCNACPAFCGDGACDKGSEDCGTCAADCGNCPTICGNGKCEMPAESYATCAKDCPPTGTCDPLTSNGCATTDQCYPTADKPVCAKHGAVAEGAVCQINTQCSKGHLCVGDKCKRICDHTGANKLVGCPQAEICDKLVYSDGKDVGFNMGSCIKVDVCNLTTEVGCPPAEMCAYTANGKICTKAGIVAAGGACKYANDCAKGLICIGNPGVCKPKCHVKGGTPKCVAGACGLVTITDPGKPPQPAPDDLGVCG